MPRGCLCCQLVSYLKYFCTLSLSLSLSLSRSLPPCRSAFVLFQLLDDRQPYDQAVQSAVGRDIRMRSDGRHGMEERPRTGKSRDIERDRERYESSPCLGVSPPSCGRAPRGGPWLDDVPGLHDDVSLPWQVPECDPRRQHSRHLPRHRQSLLVQEGSFNYLLNIEHSYNGWNFNEYREFKQKH